MSKTFLEVFPTLKVDADVKGLLEKTEVVKISANHDRNHIRIYLHAERLIFKKIIWYLEKEIKNQLFSNKDVSIKIIETFHLSGQYNAKTLIGAYKESILEELNAYSVLLYNLLRTADMQFDTQDTMTLTIDHTIIAKTRGNELIEFIEKIVCERCGLNLKINMEYRKPKESKYRRNSEEQIRQEVKAIVSRTKFGKGDEEDSKPQEDGLLIEEKTTKTTKAKETSTNTASEIKEGVAASQKSNTSTDKKAIDKKPFEKKTFEKKGEFRKKYEPGSKKSDNPDVIYGRDFDDEPMEIEKIDGPIGEVVIRGKVVSLDTREIRNEKTIVIFSITDFTDTIVLKVFAKNEDVKSITAGLKPDSFIKVKGVATIDKFDSELTIGSIVGIKKIPDFTTIRMDVSPEKRVELHCHTKMSDMDGVSEAKDIVKRAYKWGHRAIAITDHGAVQGFTDAGHVWDDLWKAEKGKRKETGEENPDKQDFFKVIYGVEAYLVDDLKEIVTLIKRLSEADFKEVEGTGDDYFDYGFRYENTKDLTNWECEHGEIVLIRSYDCDGYVKYLHSRLTKKENKHLLK
jgi:DNA polymerase-3 subunit alpha (Gram-positive type)